MLFVARRRGELLDESRNHERLNLLERRFRSSRVQPLEEIPHRSSLGSPRVRVFDRCREEVDECALSFSSFLRDNSRQTESFTNRQRCVLLWLKFALHKRKMTDFRYYPIKDLIGYYYTTYITPNEGVICGEVLGWEYLVRCTSRSCDSISLIKNYIP